MGNEYLNTGNRDDSYKTIEVTVNKRTSQDWDMTASASATRSHRWLTATPSSPNDTFYVFNANTASQIRWDSGPTFEAISQILPPRIVRLGATFSF